MLLSVKVPIAVNGCVCPLAIEGLPGEIAMDCKVADVTVSTAVLLVTLPEVAVMLELPVFRAVATPLPAIEATVPLLECQATELVRSCVLLSV